MLKIHDNWCKQQQRDYETMIQAIDTLGAAALGLHTNGAMGYTQFIEAREGLMQSFKEMNKRYRYVESVEAGHTADQF